MYRVIDATGWRSVAERLPAGRLEKELLVDPGGDVFIFKWPDEPGEAWAERLAAELGQLFALDMAEVDLGLRENPHTGRRQGTLSRHYRYTGGHAITGRWEPGVDLLQEQLLGYESLTHYTYQRVRGILEPLGLLTEFHRMLIFDAVICNIDRHDENWELFERRRLAPIFDNGRIELAFLTHNQQQRMLLDSGRRHGMYGRSVPALRWEPNEGDYYSPHHFAFLEALRETHPDEFAVAVEPFLQVPRAEMDRSVEELPPEFIPTPCRELAKVMLGERLDQLEAMA